MNWGCCWVFSTRCDRGVLFSGVGAVGEAQGRCRIQDARERRCAQKRALRLPRRATSVSVIGTKFAAQDGLLRTLRDKSFIAVQSFAI